MGWRHIPHDLALKDSSPFLCRLGIDQVGKQIADTTGDIGFTVIVADVFTDKGLSKQNSGSADDEWLESNDFKIAFNVVNEFVKQLRQDKGEKYIWEHICPSSIDSRSWGD